LWRLRFDQPLADAESWRSEQGRLREIGGRLHQLDDAAAQFMGLLRITPQGWRKIRTRIATWESQPTGLSRVDAMDTTAAEGVLIHSLEFPSRWIEVDSQLDLQRLERALLNPSFSHDFRV
jgi:choline kinase